MLRRLRKLRKNEEGATAIEFAMVAPVLFLLIFATIEMGIYFVTQSALDGAVSNASRSYKAAARSNSTGAEAGEIKSLVVRYGGGLLRPGKLYVIADRLSGWGGSESYDYSTGTWGNAGSTGHIIQYRVYYDFQFTTPIVKRVFKDIGRKYYPMRASTVVQNEPAIGGGKGV